MSTGADAKTMPATPEYEEGYERVFGTKRPERGRWVQDPATGKLIPADEYVPPYSSEHVPVVSDVYMDGAHTAEGVDIGSRNKRREYMRRNGAADASDYSKEFFRQRQEAKERATAEATKQTVVEVSRLDTRHIPKYLDEGS